jgi:hypothetical protein
LHTRLTVSPPLLPLLLLLLLLVTPQDTTSLCPKESYANVCYTPKGLAYYSDWGTLRNTGNMMFLATLMGKYGTQVGEQIYGMHVPPPALWPGLCLVARF